MNSLTHVAIIMDGNGRWGLQKRGSRNYGHLKGLTTVETIVKTSLNLKIPFITLYTFSTENWKRPRNEINFLFNLIRKHLSKNLKNIIKRGIKINVLGKTKQLPKDIIKSLDKIEKKTKSNKALTINIALNYGSKEEIISACKKLASKRKGIINLKNFEKELYTKNIPDPDILIRTGGTRRLSNFLLWQIAYAEIFFVKKMWPEFSKKDYEQIINKFKKTKRNYGSI